MPVPCDDVDAVEAALALVAAGPKSVTTDGTTVVQHDLDDLIEIADRARALCAVGRRGGGPIYRKIAPGTAD